MWITWDLGLRDGPLGNLGHTVTGDLRTSCKQLVPRKRIFEAKTATTGNANDQQIVGYLVVLPWFSWKFSDKP